MRRLIVPGAPFVVSLLLSLSTVGSTVGWQDSGFYLAAVKDLGVLYPPGFALYIVLCKAWTLLLGFVDFTLAVHLFSSVCAAGAAATVALAARDLLRSEGPLFRLDLGGNDLAAAACGILAASGFTFWSAALLAKGYALLYLVLALLLWRMIRADATGAPRDYSIVAVLIGLAWTTHPSAAGLGPALLGFVLASRRRLTGKGIAVRVALAATVAVVPSLLLPVFAARNPAVLFGDPADPAEWFRYLIGARFTGNSDHFGVESYRVVHAFRFLWEEFLVIGLGLALYGLVGIARRRESLFIGIVLWTLPSALLAVLFRIEGQLDLWLVSAWLPLHLAVAVGLATLPSKIARWALPTLAAAGLVSTMAVNVRSVSMRGYRLAELYGRYHLDALESGSVLVLGSDDALATTLYLQVVKGERPDVTIVNAARLGHGSYADHLRQRYPSLKASGPTNLVAFVEANAANRPVYLEWAPPELLESAIPVGPLLRLGPPNPELHSWESPVRLDEVPPHAGRERGIRIDLRPDGLFVEPESYEQRWRSVLVRSRSQEGQYWFRKGGEANLRKAAARFEEALAADPEKADRSLVHGLGASYYLLKEFTRAEPHLKRLLELKPTPRQAVRACSFLAAICRSQGRVQEALRYQEQGMGIVNSDPELRREYESRPKPQ